MDLNRRDFLKNGALASAAVGLAVSGLGREAEALPRIEGLWTGVPIMQGMTDAESAQFRVLVDLESPVHYEARDPHGTLVPLKILDRFVHPSVPNAAIDHLIATGLKPGVDYRLFVLDEAQGNARDERVFTSFDLASSAVRFALISCMNDRYPGRQGAMWRAVEQSNPDFVFFVGDACYADQRSEGGEGGTWKRHLETRRLLDVFRWQRLKPILATWDDHDFGVNNGDGTFNLKFATKQLFEAMFGSAVTGARSLGPGVSSVVEIAGQRFFFMDDRTERNLDALSGHWGSTQEEWFFSKLHESEKPAWVMNGSQFFGGPWSKEAFNSRHADQLNRVLERLKKASAPVAFASGDVHFSEVIRLEPELIGYETYELTSSSIHSISIPGFHRIYRNPRRENATSWYNFMIVESKSESASLQAKVRCLGANDTFFERDLSIRRG